MSKVIGITSGCFDLLHPLHVQYLTKCRRQCDELHVLIDSDRFVQENKNKVPVMNEDDRAYMVGSLFMVEETAIIDSLSSYRKYIEKWLPTQYSGDYIVRVFKNNCRIYETECLEIAGTETVFIPDVNRFSSTTEIVEYLKSKV